MFKVGIWMSFVFLLPVWGWGREGQRYVFGEEGGIVRLVGLDARLEPVVFNRDWSGEGPRGGRFPDKDGIHRWTARPYWDDATRLDGTLALERRGENAVRLNWTFAFAGDVELNDLAVSGSFSYRDVRGGKVLVDGREIPLPEERPEKRQIAYVKTAQVRVVDGRGSVRATFDFEEPRFVLVQDGRAWNSDGFSIRISVPRERPFRKGKVCSVALTYTAPQPIVMGPPDPVKIQAGPNWIPLAPGGDVVEGSALDFSKIRGTEAPAGRHGRVVARGAHFEFERLPGVEQRFYGVNVCGDANTPPTYEDARRFAARLRKMGYNAFRFHHHETDLVAGMDDPSATTLNPERIRRFDGLVAALVENGIYLTTDLYVSRRPIAWKSIGVDRPGALSMEDAKAWLLVHEGMQSNLFAFVRNWFGHVNVHTGRRLADEPALGWVSLVNEAAQGNNARYLSRQEPWQAAWRRWLAARKASEPDVYGSIDEAFPLSSSAETLKGQAYMLFLQETESAFAAKLRRFLRDELKCGALITNLNGCWYPLAFQYCRERDYDYADDHFYVDHPGFLVHPWRLPSKCPNVNPLANAALGVQGLAQRRILNRPFTCTEYNYSAPGRFRGVGGIATGALAALQGWGGLWRFAWSHGAQGVVEPEKKSLNYFDMSGDPLGLASERASMCLFLRRDLPELKRTYAISLSEDLLRRPNPNLSTWTDSPVRWSGWYARLGTQIGEAAPDGTIPLGTYPALAKKTKDEAFRDLGLQTPEDGDFPRAGDGAIHVDRETGAFFISTPRTCGGFAEEGVIRSRWLTVELEGAATVWASALDEAPLAESRRILVTHLTDVQNTDITYADEDLRVLLAWGRLPHLMRAGRADCHLRVSEGVWTVHALAADGSRRRKIPSTYARGRLSFTARVEADPSAATYLYELVREN